jgi:CheY-like chemotaxis protein
LSTGAADILLVEDDEDLRELLAELLRGHGLAVRVAQHGGEALELLRSGAALPGLILLDMMMPVMDGPTFRAAQRADPALAGIPVFVLTARGDMRSVMHGIEPARMFGKPVPLERLLAAIEDLLGGSSAPTARPLRSVASTGEPPGDIDGPP